MREKSVVTSGIFKYGLLTWFFVIASLELLRSHVNTYLEAFQKLDYWPRRPWLFQRIYSIISHCECLSCLTSSIQVKTEKILWLWTKSCINYMNSFVIFKLSYSHKFTEIEISSKCYSPSENLNWMKVVYHKKNYELTHLLGSFSMRICLEV